VGRCKRGNEPSGSTKAGDFLTSSGVLLAYREGMCYELLN
jgi:hypothetical protein